MRKMMMAHFLSSLCQPLHIPSNPASNSQVVHLLRQWWALIDDQCVWTPCIDSVELGEQFGRPSICVRLAPIPTMQNKYQDGSTPCRPITLWHGTRPAIAASICNTGIASSSRSHSVVGVLVNRQLQYALTRNSTSLDLFAGCAVQVTCENEHLITSSAVQAGDPNKAVIKLVSQTPTVYLSHIFFLIPTPAQITHRETMTNIIMEAVAEAIQASPLGIRLVPSQHIHGAMQQAVELTEYRLSYSQVQGAFDPSFGGKFNRVYPVAASISIPMALLLQAVASDAPATKLKYLKQLEPAHLPPQAWAQIFALFPGVEELMARPSRPTFHPWHVWPPFDVQQWGHLSSTTVVD